MSRSASSLPLRGILFDMDGVLCDSEPFIQEAATKLLHDRYGIRVTDEDFRDFVGTGEGRFLQGAAERYGITVELPEDKLTTYAYYLEMIRGRLRPLPGVHEFVERCRSLGLKLAVATSADRIKLEGNLQEIALPPNTFDAVVSGDQIQNPKPHPEIFVAASAKLKLDPPECLVIEDALHGITAGRRAGCACLGITSSFDADALLGAGAEWTAPDLAHVPDTIPLPRGAARP